MGEGGDVSRRGAEAQSRRKVEKGWLKKVIDGRGWELSADDADGRSWGRDDDGRFFWCAHLYTHALRSVSEGVAQFL